LYGSLDQPNSPPPEMFRAAASQIYDGAPQMSAVNAPRQPEK